MVYIRQCGLLELNIFVFVFCIWNLVNLCFILIACLHWLSGLPFPSPMHENEKSKWSRSIVSDSSRPNGLQPTRLLHPWDFPGKSTGVGCLYLLHWLSMEYIKAKILFSSCLLLYPQLQTQCMAQRRCSIQLLNKLKVLRGFTEMGLKEWSSQRLPAAVRAERPGGDIEQ